MTISIILLFIRKYFTIITIVTQIIPLKILTICNQKFKMFIRTNTLLYEPP